MKRVAWGLSCLAAFAGYSAFNGGWWMFWVGLAAVGIVAVGIGLGKWLKKRQPQEPPYRNFY